VHNIKHKKCCKKTFFVQLLAGCFAKKIYYVHKSTLKTIKKRGEQQQEQHQREPFKTTANLCADFCDPLTSSTKK
jgi:hypothetical protein